jgi:MFS family permease
MLRELLSGKLGFTSRTAFLSIILVSNAFVWYYYAGDILREIATKTELNDLANIQMWATHFGALILSAFVGASITDRLISRTRFLSIWMLFGILSPLISLIVNPADISSIITLGLVLGLSLGIGMPNCMGYYTSYTNVESRGKIGGMMILFTGLSVIALRAIVTGSVMMQALVLAAWRGFGLLVFILLKPREKIVEEKKLPSYRAILGQRSFILYFVPWVMFSLVNYLTTPVLNSVFEPSVIATLLLIENGLIGVFAVAGGFLVDSVGRKRMAIIGFVMLGLSYAILGTSPQSSLSWYFHTAVDGIAWGILFVIFVVTVWGDLSYSAPSDKYYAIGVFPFFISSFLPLAVGNQIIAIIPAYAIFSATAFFLFLAVLPLVYAPETLPEKSIRERELKSYIEKAKKTKEKYA